MLRVPLRGGSKRPLNALLVACGLLMSGMDTASAQHWCEGMTPGGDWSWAIGEFEATWADSVPGKGTGFNPFQRWRHFAEARFAFGGADGFKADAVWEATRWERLGRSARMVDADPVWHKAVPEGAPLNGGAGRINRVVVDPADTARWFACAPTGGLWVSTSSGMEWTLMGTHDWAGMGVSDVALHPDDDACVLAATGDSDFGSAYAVGLMRTCDGGASWEPTGLAFALPDAHTCSRVHRKWGDPTQILVGTSDGVWLSEDDGETFTRTLEGLCSDLVPHPGDSAVWHAALRPGALHRSTDGGRTWTAISDMPSPFAVSRYTLATSDSDPGVVAAIGARSGSQSLLGVYLSSDSGATYAALPGLPNLLGWTVSGQDAGGQGFYDLALAIDPADPAHLVAGGVNLWESFDGGGNWSCTGHWFGGDDAAFIHADHHAITFIPGSSDFISAHDGGVSRVGPTGIRDMSTGLDVGQVYQVGWTEMRPDLLISGWQDNGVNLLDREEHAQVGGADGFHCLIAPLGTDTLISTEYFGRAQRSMDGGWSWSPWIMNNGEGVHEQGDWNTPMAYSAQHPGRLFVAKHRVYWTDDGGMVWNSTEVVPGSAIEALGVAPSNDSIMVVARGGFAFSTSDRNSWQPIAGLPGLPVLDVEFDDGNPDRFWLSFGGYDPENRVWMTEDGGSTWANMGTALPAIPTNTIVRHHASGDLYAGTDAGVYLLEAGSTDWTPYKTGLPEVICTDLGIRGNTGELLLGTYGRGIWKAPLHSPQPRDAAIVSIQGTMGVPCSGPLAVSATIRNAGVDTLLSVTLLWNATDTVTYGLTLGPDEDIALEWPGATRDALPAGSTLVVRLTDVVAAEGDWSTGNLEGGVDAVPENDVLGVPWDHRAGAGMVVMVTTADCAPLESAWAILDTTASTWFRRQHFPPETEQRDTLCLTHGCHEVWLHDQAGNGWTAPQCGMEGDLVLMSVGGDTLWDVRQSGAAGIGFGSGLGGQFCLPVAGLTGCTDPMACNFDPAAEVEDGSCVGGCQSWSCGTDLDGDGLHGAADILNLLAQFGCTADCSMDITGDGAVSALDVLALLALYGDPCPE